jgi:multidrug transporter EmrE-like cation transporter
MLVLACTILGTVAQLLIKNGMDHFKLDPVALLTNLPLIAGYALYGINTVMLVLALREGELSVLYPIIALTYVWVTLAAYIRLHEAPNLYKNIGVAAIIAGVIVIGRGAKK